jgi:hypothetical protein
VTVGLGQQFGAQQRGWKASNEGTLNTLLGASRNEMRALNSVLQSNDAAVPLGLNSDIFSTPAGFVKPEPDYLIPATLAPQSVV